MSGKFFIFSVIIAILLSLDVFMRSSEDNALFVNLPICPYLSYGVEVYDNTECKTLPMISAEMVAEKEKIEKTLAANLLLLVPKRLQSLDISSSPKVQFIQEHT